MPWDHPPCGTEDIADNDPCPKCGFAKLTHLVTRDRTYRFKITRKKKRASCQLLEVEDVHFHSGGAVLLPDWEPTPDPNQPFPERCTGLGLLRACLLHASEHPEQRLLVEGHADPAEEGDPGALSRQRAEGLLHALTGDRQAWVEHAQATGGVRDVKQVLKWAASAWWWRCDPGEVDDGWDDDARGALEGFRRAYNRELDQSIAVTGEMNADTWGAVFDLYERSLAIFLEMDAEELRSLRDGLIFAGETGALPAGVDFPIGDEELKEYRSQTHRRVELRFFEPGQAGERVAGEPAAIHDPAQTQTHFLPAAVTPVPTLKVRITGVDGLYKPGAGDRRDPVEQKENAAGIVAGYKSEDHEGRVYVNHRPRLNPREAWLKDWAKDTQYVELTVEVTPTGTVPAGTWVTWTWSDPDDRSNEDPAVMRPEAGRRLDPKDYGRGGKKHGQPEAEDNQGTRDFSTAGDKGAAFEAVKTYGFSAGKVGSVADTEVVNGVSKVRLHLTNVAGDNFRVAVRLKGYPGALGDSTGVMTLWKRIDVEYVRMTGARRLDTSTIAKRYEPAFVQLDFTEEREVKPVKFLATSLEMIELDAASYATANPGQFQHEARPGWFFLAAALLPYPNPLGEWKDEMVLLFDSDRPKDGLARLVSKTKEYEQIRLPGLLDTKCLKPNEVHLVEDVNGQEKTVRFDIKAHLRWKGNSYLRLDSIRYQVKSPLSPRGSEDAMYPTKDAIDYWPGHHWGKSWKKGGYGFWPSRRKLRVRVYASKRSGLGGISTSGPYYKDGKDYFDGRAIVFTRMPGQRLPVKFVDMAVHELGHGFGLPHICGNHAATAKPANATCAMNYWNWLYKPGTRTLQRYEPGKLTGDLCDQHIEVLRHAHLEDNPVLWSPALL